MTVYEANKRCDNPTHPLTIYALGSKLFSTDFNVTYPRLPIQHDFALHNTLLMLCYSAVVISCAVLRVMD